MKTIKKEITIFVYSLSTIISVAASLGFKLSADQTVAVVAVANIVGAAINRQNVRPAAYSVALDDVLNAADLTVPVGMSADIVGLAENFAHPNDVIRVPDVAVNPPAYPPPTLPA